MAEPVFPAELPKPAAPDGFPKYMGLVPAAIVVTGLYFGRPVLLPFAMAILLAFALAPLVGRLRHIGLGRVLAVITTAVFAIGILGGIGTFMGSQLAYLAGDLPQYQTNLVAKIQSVRGSAISDGVIGRASSMLKDLRDQIAGTAVQTPAERLANPNDANKPVPVEIHQPDPSPLEIIAKVADPLLGPLAMAGIIVIFVIFILLQKDDLRDRFIRLAGSHDMQRATLALDEGAARLSNYLLTQTAINAGFGFIAGCGLWLIGIPNPLLWGLCATIFRFVPYVGIPVAALFPVALAVAVDPGWSMVLWTIALYLGGELVAGQIVEPWLYGKNMGLSAAAIVISATFWTWLWGPVGLLLSTPLTMGLVVIGRHVEHLQFLDVLLGDRPALADEEAFYLRVLGGDADEAADLAEAYLADHPLVSYYDAVALKALNLAQADFSRGLLDQARTQKIRDTVADVIHNLSESGYGAPANEAGGDAPSKMVFCVAGRSALDEASALFLIHALALSGVNARLVSSQEASATHIQKLDLTHASAVCLCYLDPGNFTGARYLLRRLRRHAPQTFMVVGFWGLSHQNTRYLDAVEIMGCDVVTTLAEATARIAAGHSDVPAEARAQWDDENSSLPDGDPGPSGADRVSTGPAPEIA